MDDTQFQSVLSDVAAGSTQTDACQKVLSTSAHLMKFLTEHPDGMVYQAALWQAEGDARIERSDRMLQKLSDRVGDGFVTTPAVARIETDQINRLRSEGFRLRERGLKLLLVLHSAEQERIAALNAPPPMRRSSSWADTDKVQNRDLQSQQVPTTTAAQTRPLAQSGLALVAAELSALETADVDRNMTRETVPQPLALTAPPNFDWTNDDTNGHAAADEGTHTATTLIVPPPTTTQHRQQNTTTNSLQNRWDGQPVEPINNQPASLLDRIPRPKPTESWKL